MRYFLLPGVAEVRKRTLSSCREIRCRLAPVVWKVVRNNKFCVRKKIGKYLILAYFKTIREYFFLDNHLTSSQISDPLPLFGGLINWLIITSSMHPTLPLVHKWVGGSNLAVLTAWKANTYDFGSREDLQLGLSFAAGEGWPEVEPVWQLRLINDFDCGEESVS